MGPITGIRIVNLRVREKVAYPDVTIDLAGINDEHLVVGLENGGGKSTLLGAVFHIFVAEADQFLMRRAQQRQSKEGELKRLEHYVPGGDPTHFVVEVEPPNPNGMLPMNIKPQRMVIGACLWKPTGASSSTHVDEFFWSGRCVDDQLMLRNLGLRGPNGRLLDHREFQAKLKQLRIDLPAAQLNIENGKSAWEQHLRSLGIDVEYVKQFLLRMNEDEGAADKVFTYASSRAFLNSLVEVVGDASTITQVKHRLLEMSIDADAMVLDQKRTKLLENIVAQTGPLASAMRDLEQVIADRKVNAERLVAAIELMKACLNRTKKSVTEISAQRAKFELSVNEVRNSYNDANARYMLSRVQVARLQLCALTEEVKKGELLCNKAREAERVARAAELLSVRRTLEARIGEVENLLKLKEKESEPLRQALSSATQALRLRLSAEIQRLSKDHAQVTSDIVRAGIELEHAGENRSTADNTLGVLEGERKVLITERGILAHQIGAAVLNGVLPHEASEPKFEASRARDQAAREHEIVLQKENNRQLAHSSLQNLSNQIQELAENEARADLKISTARSELSEAVNRTDLLSSDVSATGLIEFDPLVLDDHAEAILARLKSAMETMRLRQASIAVRTAAAERASTWLREQERLPPRFDVERICEKAAAQRLGARSGWAYLSTLSEDVAESYAIAHPALADGIVVNVPEDLKGVVSLAREARDELEAPIVVGLAAAFNSIIEVDNEVTVILPHSAYWSMTAGRKFTEIRSAEADQLRTEYDRIGTNAEDLLKLSEKLTTWVSDIGPRGLDVRRLELQQLEDERARLVKARADIANSIVVRTNERNKAEAERDAARNREQNAMILVTQLVALIQTSERQKKVEIRLDEIHDAVANATRDREEAMSDFADARKRETASTSRLQQIAVELKELDTQLIAIESTAVIAVREGDSIDQNDKLADRQLLTSHFYDREKRWRGSVSDPQLRAQLELFHESVKDIEERLSNYASEIDNARARLVDDPSRSSVDYRNQAEENRRQVEQLVESLGNLKSTERQQKEILEKVQEEHRALRRSATLAPQEITEILGDALLIQESLREARDNALILRSSQEAELQNAIDSEIVTTAREELQNSVVQRLGAGLLRITSGGPIVPKIEVSEILIDEKLVLTHSEVPEELLALLRAAGRPPDDANAPETLEADKAASLAAINWLDTYIESQRKSLNTLELKAEEALEATEALLRNASEDVVRGDRVIQTLRASPRRTLAELAVEHHDDIVQRHIAVRHHVASFDARLDALSNTVFASIANLLREVRKTVHESRLPNTPALGRWAGLDLLQLSGLDTLKKDQRQAAIASTLRGWFNPERPEDRPRSFDSNTVIHELLAAVTPQLVARILIPSDPLDPEHKPVDQLSRETSGGEGVTVALIIASLLASRRAIARGHRRTTLLFDNPFAKVTKPEFLRIVRDVASELNVQLVLFTGVRDLEALTVFPRLTQLRVSRRENANFVVPYNINDERLQALLREGTLFVSPSEWEAHRRGDKPNTWPLMSSVSVADRGARKET